MMESKLHILTSAVVIPTRTQTKTNIEEVVKFPLCPLPRNDRNKRVYMTLSSGYSN